MSGVMTRIFALGEGLDDDVVVAEYPAATRDLTLDYVAEARRLYAKS